MSKDESYSLHIFTSNCTTLSGSVEDWVRYKRLRNDLAKVMQTEKMLWQQGKLASCEDNLNTGKLWKNILGWLNWRSTCSPTKLLNNGDMVTSPKRIADVQNEYYIKKVMDIRRNMPRQKNDPLATLKRIMTGRASSFPNSAVSPK